MKQVNFSHSGGFPLEQETLERLQTAYRSELFEALKSHLSIEKNKNYVVAPATEETLGWAIIHQDEKDPKDPKEALKSEGILYPILKGTNTGYLKTTRTGTNLTYGDGTSQTAYFDYEAVYISQSEFTNGISKMSDVETVYFYDLSTFKIVKDIKAIEGILQAIDANINQIKADINLINQTYLPLDGSKAMTGDFSMSSKKLLQPTNSTGRALANSSDATTTSLSLNYVSDWQNTVIGGKVHLNNLNTSNSAGSLLVIDNSNQVTKSNSLPELLNRITALESKISAATAVPVGMIAIWGKPAPFPDGWAEYIPLRGKMPVGLFNPTPEERSDLQDADGGNGITYYRDANGSAVFPFDTLEYTSGRIGKTLRIEEMPSHNHTFARINSDSSGTGNQYVTTGDGDEGPGTGGMLPAGGGQQFSILNPYTVVQFIEYIGHSNDTKPTNLTASNIAFTSLTLTWTAPTDNAGVSNYILYKNGIVLATLGGSVISYPVTGLTAGTAYTFSVVARDTAGNLSAASTISATTKNVDPTIPTNLNGESQGENAMYISWGAPAMSGVINYEIWRRQSGNTNSALHKTVEGTVTSYVDTGNYNTTYVYKVRAVYASGPSGFTESEIAITTDPINIECFDVESLVTMASGQSKKLKNIVVGDKLQGFSFPNEIDESDGDYMIWNGKLNEATKAEVTVVNKITSVQPNYFEIKTYDTTIKVTGQHPLLVTEDGENVKWICVKNVLQGMLLIDKTGKTKVIESIEFKEEPLEVALLDVENVDNYVISGIIAHNNKPLDPRDPQP